MLEIKCNLSVINRAEINDLIFSLIVFIVLNSKIILFYTLSHLYSQNVLKQESLFLMAATLNENSLHIQYCDKFVHISSLFDNVGISTGI